MAHEIERKFLVTSDSWRGHVTGVLYRQGYLSTVPERTVRVRTAGSNAFLTVKGLTIKTSRLEFEYAIPLADAEAMLPLCDGPVVEKMRFEIVHAGKLWQVDEYLGDNRGLIVAEIELDSESEEFAAPDWLGREVSNDPRYYNSNLATFPYSQWQKPA